MNKKNNDKHFIVSNNVIEKLAYLKKILEKKIIIGIMQSVFAETDADVVEPDRKTGSDCQEKPDPVSTL